MKRSILILLIVFLLLPGCSKTDLPTNSPSASPTDTQTEKPSASPEATPTNSETPTPSQSAAPVEEDNNAYRVSALREGLKKDKLTASDDLITLFFKYYSSSYGEVYHPMELRLLPSFAKGEAPPWEALTHFIFYPAEKSKSSDGSLSISKEGLKTAVNRLFQPFEYTDQDSDFLQLKNGEYVPVGWDDNGAVYYRFNRYFFNIRRCLSGEFRRFLDE